MGFRHGFLLPCIGHNTLTSISEILPLRSHEGARAGLPTISSKVGGVSYLIDHGANGFLFPPGDDRALANHLLTLARDPALRKAMGHKLYEKAKREFSIEATIQRQMEIYETILRYEKNGRDQVVICGAYGRATPGTMPSCWPSFGNCVPSTRISPAKCSPATPLTPAGPIG